MIPKGLGDIKGLRSINNRAGPMTSTTGFLRLYQLSGEKDSMIKKLEWINRQKEQTEKRISGLAYTIRAVEEKTHRELTSDVHTESRRPFITY
jgi:hypothetical protein